ncbi:CoA transferase [Nocardia harenae]|uniref:CoA transferase n=1 Tax=Nocardia harenae TaxID=358707 RepID=UPI000832C0C6|nr:CoA transferase [Nocardia harenae]
MTDGILEGLRVVDLTTGLAGPAATRTLAEAGAEVVKVESRSGDPARATSAFPTLNRSKRSVIADLETPEGRATLESLLAGADVLVHGYTPAVARGHGLDPETLGNRFPALVVCSVTGYPVNHPDAELPGHDLLVQARSGLMGEALGHRDGPIPMRFPLPSWGASALAAGGILARLLVREQTGRGGSVHTSLLQGMLNTVSLFWNRASNPIPELFLTKYETAPTTALYECGDGVWLQLMNPGEKVPLRSIPLVRELVSELGAEAESITPGGDEFRSLVRLRPSSEWLAALRGADIAVEPALHLGELLRDPDVLANDYTVTLDDPEHGRIRQPGLPFEIEPPLRVRGPAPLLGQDDAAELAAAAPARATTATTPGPDLPLSGLKILDLGSFLAGPMAPMLMADLGADVIKVEPVSGDRLRYKACFWEACSRNKRAIALDITSEDGQGVLRRLVEWADVVHHNQRARAAVKNGIDEETIRRINPDVVFGYVSSYGERGGKTDNPGYDSVFQALGGWEVENGGTGNPPQFSRLGTLDVQTALTSFVGTMLALYHRARTGRSTTVKGSLLRSTTMTQSETFLRLADDTLAPYPRFDAEQVGYGPGNRIYEAADGWIAVVTESGEQLAELRAAVGAGTDSDIAGAILKYESGELLERLATRGIPAELVREEYQFEFFDRPENIEAGLIVGYDHAFFGRMEQPGAYWHFPDFDLRFDRAAPIIGQQTREVLTELGYSPDSIDALYDGKVVAGPVIPAGWSH